MKCLGCSAEMTSMMCACGGAWIHEAELAELTHDVRGAMVTLPWATRRGDARACPTCAQPMRTVSLASVALDRCFDHGIWFDADELQAVLRKAQAFPEDKAPPPPSPPPRAMSAAPAPAPDPVEVAVADDSSGDTASGVLAFFGALLEIIIDVATD